MLHGKHLCKLLVTAITCSLSLNAKNVQKDKLFEAAVSLVMAADPLSQLAVLQICDLTAVQTGQMSHMQ